MTPLRLRLEQPPREWLEGQNEDVRKYVLAVLEEHAKSPGRYLVTNQMWNNDPDLGQAYAAKMYAFAPGIRAIYYVRRGDDELIVKKIGWRDEIRMKMKADLPLNHYSFALKV